MKKIIFILVGFVLFSFSQSIAQQNTAAGYWNMEHDPLYIKLLDRQNAGDTLSPEEQKTLADYKTRLSEYFEKLSDNEKSLYYKNRAAWTQQPETLYRVPPRQETDVYSGERSMYTQYLISSGIFGAIYGGAVVAIIGLGDEEGEGGAAVGIPLLTAGASVLIPVLTIKDKNISYNSLSLSNHGRAMGLLQGAALGALLTGENIEDGKLILALSAASSIAMGRLGYSLGKNKPWSQGRAALYSYYGLLMPLEGLALDVAFEAENPRVYGLTSLLFGAGGYLLADKIAQQYDYTKGDITATGTLAALNGLIGLLIISDIASRDEENLKPGHILFPAIGAMGGSLVGHYWLKDARLTNQQGRNIALTTAGGAAMGAGLIALFSPETGTPYYVASYLTGMSTYAIMVGMYKKQNNITFFENQKKTGWNLNVMPQNIFINNKIAAYAMTNPGKRINFLPAFSATLKF